MQSYQTDHEARAVLRPAVQFLLLELEDGTYAIILPLIDRQTYRGTLRPPRQVLRSLVGTAGWFAKLAGKRVHTWGMREAFAGQHAEMRRVAQGPRPKAGSQASASETTSQNV